MIFPVEYNDKADEKRITFVFYIFVDNGKWWKNGMGCMLSIRIQIDIEKPLEITLAIYFHISTAIMYTMY